MKTIDKLWDQAIQHVNKITNDKTDSSSEGILKND